MLMMQSVGKVQLGDRLPRGDEGLPVEKLADVERGADALELLRRQACEQPVGGCLIGGDGRHDDDL